MENLLCQTQLELMKDAIQIELLKRGIHAPIILIEEYVGNHDKNSHIRLKTSEFTTTPTLFKKIWVEDFGSGLEEETVIVSDGELTKINVYVNIHYSYEHFGGGRNGCSIFGFNCTFRKDLPNDIFKISIS